MDNSQKANNLIDLTKPEVIRRAIRMVFPLSVNEALVRLTECWMKLKEEENHDGKK